MAECKWFQVCPLKRFYEKGKLDKKWAENYCKGNWRECERYKLEEKGISHLDWLLPNGKEDKSLLEQKK